jgi:hypothetical protein
MSPVEGGKAVGSGTEEDSCFILNILGCIFDMFVLSGVNCPVITPSMGGGGEGGGAVNKLNTIQSLIHVFLSYAESMKMDDTRLIRYSQYFSTTHVRYLRGYTNAVYDFHLMSSAHAAAYCIVELYHIINAGAQRYRYSFLRMHKQIKGPVYPYFLA